MSKLIFDIQKVMDTPHHPAMEEMVDLLCHRTGNVDRSFFQATTAYFLALIPASLRAKINSPERGILPINVYTIAAATSGFGKGHSVNLLENVVSDFRQLFMTDVLPSIAEDHIHTLATNTAVLRGTDEGEEKTKLKSEYAKQGQILWNFDSGTAPALKQLRHKLLLAACGSLNFQMDEIGSNLSANAELMNVFLELYDLGKVKTKLIKNTADQERGVDLMGTTPTNALLFGTLSKLLDGSKTEEEFFSFLETGFGRRSFFGLGKPEAMASTVDPELLYESLVCTNKAQSEQKWKDYFASFADRAYYNLTVDVPKHVGIHLLSYRLYCEGLANDLPEHEVIRKAELSHRYFKSLKLAGVYAFLDHSKDITKQHLNQAIRVSEESGASFAKILKRERNFVRVAKFIAEAPDSLTHADLVEDLPFYPSSATPRRELMDLAMAWGASNHVAIQKKMISGVEFFSGETLKETDLNKMTFSFSDHFAERYNPQEQPFEKLPKLLAANNLHWCNHTFKENHRLEANVQDGFNMIVIDVDGAISLDACHDLLKQYTFITATTKRHTDDKNRFRLIMPMDYVLNLDKSDYGEFMDSFMLWLPFKSDNSARQRSKKWMTNSNSQIHVNQGEGLISVLPFIPKTNQNSEYVNSIVDLGKLDNLERWFLKNMEVGDRNNHLHKFAMMLVDGGMKFDEIKSRVHTLNKQSDMPLPKDEVDNTILKSIATKI